MTELFEENLGDCTTLHIPSGGINNLVQRRLKVATMCELDCWKRVPSRLPHPGEQFESPVLGATQSLAGGNPCSSPANSRSSRTNNADGSVVWQAREGLGVVRVIKAGK